MDIKTGDSAFPHDGSFREGMSLLDYFASSAMAAIIANVELMRIIDQRAGQKSTYAIAELAYRQAAAMLELHNNFNVKDTKIV